MTRLAAIRHSGLISAILLSMPLAQVLAAPEQAKITAPSVSATNRLTDAADTVAQTPPVNDRTSRNVVTDDSVADTVVEPSSDQIRESSLKRMAQIERQEDLTLQAYHRALATLEENGPYFQQSSEVLYDLGTELQKRGHHGEALDTLQRAMHVNRVNHGLYSLAQAPMLRRIIHSEKALSLFEEVTSDYYRLLTLHLKNTDTPTPKLVNVQKELAFWHVEAYHMDRSSSRVDHLTSAHSLINAAISNANALTLDTTNKIDLLRTMALISFYFSTHKGDEWASATDSRYSASADKINYLQPARTATLSNNSFRNGLLAHEQIVALATTAPDATTEQKIAAYIETGDWHLLFNRRRDAMQFYTLAQQLITASDHQKELAVRWFGAPKLLPQLHADYDEARSGMLYVKAKLHVSDSGRPSRVKIVEPPAENNRILRRAALDKIKSSRFRPRFVEGQVVASPDALIHVPMVH